MVEERDALLEHFAKMAARVGGWQVQPGIGFTSFRDDRHALFARKPHHRGQGPKRQGGNRHGEHRGGGNKPTQHSRFADALQQRDGEAPRGGFPHKQHGPKPEGARNDGGRPQQAKPAGKRPFRRKRRPGFGSKAA